MQQQILISLDGSAQAETILPYVVALARETQRALHLVHVLPPPYVSIPRDGITIALPQNYQATLRADASDYLKQLATHLESEGMEVDTSVLEGEPAEAIQQVCQQYHPDVLVMASPRQNPQQLSSHARMAAEVIETLGKPVLLIG